MPFIDYKKENETRDYKNKYVKCNCGKFYTRINKKAHEKTRFHREFKNGTVIVRKKKIKKEKENIEYDTIIMTIWGNYKL